MKNKIHLFAYHSAGWIISLLVPVVIFVSEGKPFGLSFGRTFRELPLLMVIFYINYFWAIEKFWFEKKKRWFFLLLNILLIFGATQLKFMFFFNTPPPTLNVSAKPPISRFSYFDFLTHTIPVVFAVAIRYAQRVLILQQQKKAIEVAHLNAQLQHLKYQLQPHFFFNALNTIYSLIAFDPEKAQKSVHTLSKLMRHFLQTSQKSRIFLQEEVQFIEQYIELMRLRLTDKTKVVTHFPKDIAQREVAPLLLITLVENAFKHGVSATLSTEITFALHLEGKKLSFEAKNTLLPKNSSSLEVSHIGIDNLKKQLNLLYPNKHEYTISQENGQYRACICLVLD